uniref:FYVE-type domain-containing protein n=1 Tax=Hyaloperonospora arabidopsidis (strain Emoy2) TaxID=559515 RepID=M4B9P2_HYAAE
MSHSPSAPHSRSERGGSVDKSSSLFRRFQGKKSSNSSNCNNYNNNNRTTAMESLASSQPPPRHSHRRMLSRDRRRPMVIYYSPTAADDLTDSALSSCTSSCSGMFTDGELSDDDSPRSRRGIKDGDDRFDADSSVPDFAASTGSRDLTTSRHRGPGGALSRMSQSFGRASERMDSVGEGRREYRRAVRQSAKYDVAWREDDESACCKMCFAMFTKLSRRRHHCRVCGELVCGACSQDLVSLTDKFPAPRRACVACCSLLQAMARAGDDRVKVVESDVASAAAFTRHHHSAPVAATCHSPSMPTPTATPRYRDRLTEVHRVMAAGQLSRRRASAEKKMFVISSRWLRRWMAFTSSASSSDSRCSLDYGFSTDMSISSPRNVDTASEGSAPGPIDNMSLLELCRGKLMRRPGLVRDEAFSGDAASTGEDADFQLISPEVWEVFQRLYGGAPAISVNLTCADPMAWIIDVSGLLAAGTNANGTKIQVSAAVERALTARHKVGIEVASVRDGSSRGRTPAGSGSHRSVDSCCTSSKKKPQPPKSPAETVTSSSSSSSLSEEKECTPTRSGKMQLEDLESDVAALSIDVIKAPSEDDDDIRATTSARSPTAALAASAFAVAMKQARLNAQKAIDDRASRVIAA